MEEKLLQYISDNGLIMAGDRILIGVSGGADSLALLHFLKKHQAILKIQIAAAHLNHAIRGKAADEDLAFVKKFCFERSVLLYDRTVDVIHLAKKNKISLEEAGREARYAFFKELQSSKAYNKLALGHHLNDQAETVLMRLIRGTGIKGAAGMLSETKGERSVIRPLLCVDKVSIISYCKENDLHYRTDDTNFETDVTRNKLRLEIIPALQSINPRVEDHLAEFALLAYEHEQLLQNSMAELSLKMITKKSNRVYLNLEMWRQQISLIQKELLREMILQLKGSLKEIEYNHILCVKQLLLSEKTVWDMHLPHGMQAVRRYDLFWIEERKTPVNVEIGCYELLPDKVYYFAKEGLWIKTSMITDEGIKKSKELKNHSEKYFDYGKIRRKLYLRNRRPGDFFKPVGIEGKKKIKDYFIDRKIEREKRDAIPMLAVGSEVVWILGYAINREYQPGPETQSVLKVQYQIVGEKFGV
ncbi:tRNA lysidine(34) synthetase TilS [Eubacterium sp. 1001713B170207_170306_E7]|uniref:tRNA lysidine(34) synthetase TilS n=1 Tax=Eubacterium sp. 1001713B170207_170306_E7 TaxID=2787097 RepID=UPI0018977559|nr:tRNA lysidine(34) synthetase TilS [Eubacterium sp. 1001713B170207_170306_E7]